MSLELFDGYFETIGFPRVSGDEPLSRVQAHAIKTVFPA